MQSVAQFEELCPELLLLANQLSWDEKCPFLEPASVRVSSKEAGLSPATLYCDDTMELEKGFSPKIATKDWVPYTVAMNAITVFNGDAKDSSDDAPCNDFATNLDLDNEVWSLLMEYEETGAKAAMSDSTNITDNLDQSIIPVTHSSCNNNVFDPLVDMLDDDLDQFFELPPEIDTDLIQNELSSLGCLSESTADMLANVISDTGLFITPSPNDNQSDTTLCLGEILQTNLAKELAEQVVPDEVKLESAEVVACSQPVIKRKRKYPKDHLAADPVEDRLVTPPPLLNKANKFPHEDRYTMMRIKNNEASKRSRQSRKNRHLEMDVELIKLEEHNVKLKAEAERLEKAVNQLKSALTSTVLKLKS